MSTPGTGLHGCPDLQAELEGFFTTCDASLLPDPSAINEFLWSGLNRSGIQQGLVPGNGKIRTLQLRYDQAISESDVDEVSSCDRVCVATTKRGDLITNYEIDTCDKLRIEELINANDFKEACRGNSDILNKKMRLMMNALLKKVSTKMVGLAAGYFGHWPTDVQNKISDGGVDTLKIATKLASGAIDPEGMYDLDFAIQQTQFCNGAIVFGGAALKKYADLMNAGCCASTGLNVAEILAQFGYAVTYDRRLDVELGDSIHGMVLGVRALQPVYFTANNDGINDAIGLNVGANYQKQVIYEPMTGMGIDLTLSDDCGDVSIIMETVVDLKALPADIFAPDDRMVGTNWVNKVKIVNP